MARRNVEECVTSQSSNQENIDIYSSYPAPYAHWLKSFSRLSEFYLMISRLIQYHLEFPKKKTF